MPHDDPYVPGLRPWRSMLRKTEPLPGTVGAHISATPEERRHRELCDRLDRLIELQERQLAQGSVA